MSEDEEAEGRVLRTTRYDHYRPPAGPTEVASVSFPDGYMQVDLTDGRKVLVPLSWFPILEKASDQDRANYEIIAGDWIHWEKLDEDLGLDGLLRRL